jgi:hypothetical protein
VYRDCSFLFKMSYWCLRVKSIRMGQETRGAALTNQNFPGRPILNARVDVSRMAQMSY